jgi:hypothetical protein
MELTRNHRSSWKWFTMNVWVVLWQVGTQLWCRPTRARIMGKKTTRLDTVLRVTRAIGSRAPAFEAFSQPYKPRRSSPRGQVFLFKTRGDLLNMLFLVPMYIRSPDLHEMKATSSKFSRCFINLKVEALKHKFLFFFHGMEKCRTMNQWKWPGAAGSGECVAEDCWRVIMLLKVELEKGPMLAPCQNHMWQYQ